jgi:hypothetical protein
MSLRILFQKPNRNGMPTGGHKVFNVVHVHPIVSLLSDGAQLLT